MASTTMDVLITIFTGLVTIILSFATISASISMIKGMVQKKVAVSGVAIGSTITLIFFLFSGLSTFCYTIKPSYIFRLLPSLFYIFAELAMQYAFISRVHFIFNGSSLQISKCTSKAFYYSWFSILAVGIFTLVINVAYPPLVFVLGPAWILLFLSLSVALIILFLCKLRNLIITTSVSNSNASQSSILSSRVLRVDPVAAENSFLDMELLYVAIKNAILVPIAIGSSFIAGIIAMGLKMNPQYDGYVPQVLAIDCTISSVMMYLLFAFNKAAYNVLCFKMHSLCQVWCVGSISHKSIVFADTSHTTPATATACSVPSVEGEVGGEQESNILRIHVGNSSPLPHQHLSLTNLTIESHAYATSNPLMTFKAIGKKGSYKKDFPLIVNTMEREHSDPVQNQTNKSIPSLRITSSNLI